MSLRYSLALLASVLLSILSVNAQTTVGTLAALKSAVLLSNQDIVMTPSEYNFEDLPSGSRKIVFSGSNNTITLRGVYIKVPVGCVSENYLDVSGNNNTIIGGEFEDTYRNGMTVVTDFSAYNADKENQAHGLGGDAVMQIGGTGNLVRGLKLTVRGSFPFGYGSIYGIGSTNAFGLNKRCGILINGVSNTLDSVEVQQRAFGHGIFMQGNAGKTLIKNSLVEGRVRATAEFYTETNSFDLPYKSNYKLPLDGNVPIPTNEYNSLSEDGIRMYNIPGSVTVENCTVKKMRGGIRLYLGGDALVRNSKAIDCGLTNFNTQSGGQTINSSGNFTYAPLLDYRLNRNNTSVEVTILPSPNATGAHNIADIAGNNNTITFHRTPGPLVKTDRAIVVVGSNSTIINETEYPIILEASASGNKITSCGPVSDLGTGNSVTLSSCDFDILCSNTADDLEAECYDDMLGIETMAINTNNDAVSNIQNGDWISFQNVDLTNMNAVKAIVSSAAEGAAIELRDGSVSGDLLGTIPVPNTGDLTSFEETAVIALDQTVDGLHDVYFVFQGPSGLLFNLDEISFLKDQCIAAFFNPLFPIEAEGFCEAEGVVKEQQATFNEVIGSIDDGDFVVYPNVDFGNERNYNAVQVYASSNEAGGSIEVRSGAIDGELLATVEVSNTGAWSDYQSFSAYTSHSISGVHDIYLVFTGSEGSLFNLDKLYFRNDPCGYLTDAYSQIAAIDYCEMSGIVPINNSYVGGIHDGEWIRFGSVDFTSTSPLSVKLSLAGLSSTEGYVNIRLDHPLEGTLIATAEVPKTGGWEKWQEVLVRVNQEVTGVHNVYVYFGNEEFNIDWIQFSDIFVKGPTNPYERFEAEINDGEKGTEVTATSDVDGGDEVSDIEDGDYIMFSQLDLKAADSLKLRVASALDGGVIEVRLGSATGNIIAFVDVPNTGSSSLWQTVSASIGEVEGVWDVFFVFRGEGADLFKLNWLQFISYSNPFGRLEAEDNDSNFGTFLPGATTDDDDNGVGSVLRFAKSGNWVRFEGVDLSGAKSVTARYSTTFDDGLIEVRLDSLDGNMLATLRLDNTNNWNTWETAGSNISELEGEHDVYFVYQSDANSIVCSSNWFQFSGLGLREVLQSSDRIEAEDYDRASGTITIATSDVDGGSELASIENNDWILFENVDLTDVAMINVRVSNPSADNTIYFRLDSYDGPLYSFFKVPATGSSSDWQTMSTARVFSKVGVYDLYVIFKSSSDELLNINWLELKGTSTGLSARYTQEGIKLFPNPVKDYLNIEGELNSGFEILNSLGQQVMSGQMNNETHRIDVNELNKGVYILRIQENSIMKTQKFIKQ